ncbi:MAG: sulfite oxidase heme-binding subunit YedZ [Rhodospirillaceae bacterium]
MRAAISARALLWLVLALPACYMLLAYARGEMVYGAFIHWTGDVAAWLLMFTLALTPLKRLFPGRRWPTWLLQRRRYVGVASFAYAAVHTAAYLMRQPWARVTGEALERGMLAGWIAFAIFIPLAATSTNAAVRAMGRRWKTLHRWVYAAAVLTLAHWAFTAFDPALAYAHGAGLAVILAVRSWPRTRAT